VISTGVRWRLSNVLAAVFVTACTTSLPAGAPASTTGASPARAITASNIRRLGHAFPAGYELAQVHSPGARSPAGYWGFGGDFDADPAQCAALANPVTGEGPPQGLAGSGAGGIVYAVVVASSTPLQPDPAIVADCPRWSMTAGRTSAAVELTRAPQIEGVATVGMRTTTRTIVEGGTGTASQIQTVSAYLGDYLAFVAVVTDPGATATPLPPDFASELLVKAVAALRG
jgi:Domain of unknown function (DUF5642)